MFGEESQQPHSTTSRLQLWKITGAEVTFKGASIAPEELGEAMKKESLPLQWLGASEGQNKDGRFPMMGKGKGEGETIRWKWKGS